MMLYLERVETQVENLGAATRGKWWTLCALVSECFNHGVAGFQFYRLKNLKIKTKPRAVRLSEEQIESMPGRGGRSCFDEIERVGLSYTDDLMLSGGRVPDSTFSVLKNI
jgi:hypothetical protein